jgi:hypothetical protein
VRNIVILFKIEHSASALNREGIGILLSGMAGNQKVLYCAK